MDLFPETRIHSRGSDREPPQGSPAADPAPGASIAGAQTHVSLNWIDPRRFDPIYVHEEGDPDCYCPEYRVLVDIALNYDSAILRNLHSMKTPLRNTV